VTGGTLVVKLADNANGRVNADAIRIERLASASMLDDSPTPGTVRGPSVGLLDAGLPGPRAERASRLVAGQATETTSAAVAETVDRAVLELLEPLDRARPTPAQRSDCQPRGDDVETVLDDELLDELLPGRI
jgi:hypothetical protein